MATININDNAGSEFSEAIIQALHDAGMTLINATKIEMTEKHIIDTGIGRNGITHRVDERDYSCTVGCVMDYLAYVHEGTGIYARSGNGRKEVPWRYKDAKGKWHTTKGQKSQPFMEDAFYKSENDVRNCFRGCLDR